MVEFLGRVAESDTSLCSGMDFPESLDLLAFLEEQGFTTKKELDRFPALRALGVSATELQENFPKFTPQIQEDGIYVDVDGTLLIREEPNWDEQVFNEELHKALVEAVEAGVQVTIFTGGWAPDQQQKLFEAGLSPVLFPVRSKGDFSNRFLELSVDDSTTTDYHVLTYIPVDGSEAELVRGWLAQRQ